MNSLSRFVFTAAALVLVTSCGPSKTLHLYTWADYVSPDLVKRFEKENDCRVVIDTFDSNESMLSKLQGGASGYDLAVPSSYMVKLMNEQGMLLPLDKAKLPNIGNVDEAVLEKVYDKKMEHSVPYAVGFTVIAYRKDKISDPEPSWSIFDRTDLNPKTTLLNDMRETIGAALKFLGYSANSLDEAQLAQARDVAIRWKKNAAKFENEQYKAGIDSGEFSAVMGYSGDLFQVVSENENVGILVPKEGVTMACDELVILKGAPDPELAHKWINFLLEPEVSAENMDWMGYLCPNKEGIKQMSKEFLENPAVSIPPEVQAKSEVIEDLGANLPKYTKVWDEVKAGE